VALPAPSPPPGDYQAACEGECDEKQNRGKHKGWDNDSPEDHDHGRGNDGRDHGDGHGRDK
jgi:hypothetical protein